MAVSFIQSFPGLFGIPLQENRTGFCRYIGGELMELGYLLVIWVANGVIPIGLFLLFLIDHVIQGLMRWRKEGVI